MIDPRITAAFLRDNGFQLEPHLVVLGLVGSHSHGTYLPPEDPDAIDDVDLMGFVVPPIEYHLGTSHFENWVLQFEELDVVLYSLSKAVRLLLKSNPNIVGMLWLRDEEYVHRTPAFDRLRAERSMFSSQQVASSFAGYAHAQIKKMEAFDLSAMERYEALTEAVKPAGDVSDILRADAARMKYLAKSSGVPVDTLYTFRQLHRSHFSGFMGKKRKDAVRRFGYDCKNASHLIRLLRMCVEFLQTGQLYVYRTKDADELKAIKRGGWTLEQVKAEAARLFVEVERAREQSRMLPDPDHERANRLLVDLHMEVLGLR